ncbi:MAG: hypothetical protein A2542_03880 [Parcubacteria group bacterium RIFOXYD2_FULL_52_8]|nr:MAG: hypothetical protein A2542_03880 [Parcubacteria group bacterium RIFOXYD2_FULL_52_8]
MQLLQSLIIALSFPIAAIAQSATWCAPEFVWSAQGQQCVQEVCPGDAIGRDMRGRCICAEERMPITQNGRLVSCVLPPPPKKVSPSVVPPANTAALPLVFATSSLPRVATSTFATTSVPVFAGTTTEATTAELRRRGFMWPVATPTTITLIFLVAAAIGYYLYTHKPKKK